MIYDYIFAGTGVAAILLLDEILHSELRDSKILLIDITLKNKNDRTLSFWEKTPSRLDKLVFKTWKEVEFADKNFIRSDLLTKYQYKSIKGLDLYNYLFALIKTYSNVEFLQDEVMTIEEQGDFAILQTKSDQFSSKYVFDSRFNPKEFDIAHSSSVKQMFTGMVIKTKEPAFEENKVRMIDLRLSQENCFRFVYTLPFSQTEALIELITYNSVESDNALKEYISGILNIQEYEVIAYEGGPILLTDGDFKRRVGDHVLKIGIAGGLIKPSSGYGYTRMKADAVNIVESLKKTGSPFFKSKTSIFYKLCDSLLLNVLQKNPQDGIKIFSGMMKYNKAETILKFLDEQASLRENLNLMASMYPLIFLKAFFRKIFR